MDDKILRKRGLCSLAECDELHFKTLRARDQLAFDIAYDGDELGGWQRFSIRDAFLLRCQLDMMAEGGVAPDVAAKAVRNAIGWLDGDIFEKVRRAKPSQDVFIGVERWRDEDGTIGAGHFAGTLTEIAILSEAEADRQSEYASTVTRFRLVLVNASGAARRVLGRAKDTNILAVAEV